MNRRSDFFHLVSRVILVLVCAALALPALAADAASAADGTIDTFSAKLSSKQFATARGKAVLVKTVVLKGSGLLQGRPQIKCGTARCLRLTGRRYSRSKFYKPKVTFKNANILVKRGQSITIRLVPNDKKLLGRYVTFSLKRKGKLRLRESAAGCITGGGRLAPCPSPPTGLNCNRPAPGLPKASLAAYLGSAPRGTVDAVAEQVSNSINVQGWAFDPDQPDVPIWLHTYVDGVFAGANLAELTRGDVATAFPGVNTNHGYSFNIPGVASGNHTVSVFAIDLEGVNNPLLWSGSVNNVHSTALGSPFGVLESGVAVDCGAVELSGWTADPSNGDSSTEIHVYIDGWPGQATGAVNFGRAELPRPDVAANNPGFSVNRGFKFRISNLPPGPHVFYVYAINASGPGENPLLRVVSVNVP